MDFMTTLQAAELWNISSRRVSTLCKEGRIKGAKKIGGNWLIPINSAKPIDRRYIKENMSVTDYYKELEAKFNVILPNSEHATYKSILNYSNDIEKPRQRWYRYKEGYSIELVKYLINEQGKGKKRLNILDPFLGSGTTILAANELNHHGIGFEVNPFSYFLSMCKVQNYTEEDAIKFKEAYELILDIRNWEGLDYTIPELSIAEKVLEPEIFKDFLKIKTFIMNMECNDKVKSLLKLGWLSVLETISLYRKAGNGLKRKTSKKNIYSNIDSVLIELNKIYTLIYADILDNRIDYSARIINDTSLNMSKYIDKETIDGVIFSPPYANCFDYTEIYKLELWFGEFVQDYSDLKVLRGKSLSSHLNGITKTDMENLQKMDSKDPLHKLMMELEGKKIWSDKIPIMLQLYFEEMNSILDNIYSSLREGGFCNIIVGNSVYGGIVFPTDLLLASYAEKIGFIVDKIEVDRYIITSSQQYEITRNSKNMIRESVICLKK